MLSLLESSEGEKNEMEVFTAQKKGIEGCTEGTYNSHSICLVEYKRSHPCEFVEVPNIHVLIQKNLGGGHFSFDVFWLEVCLRLQKNLGSRILIGRNILLKPFPCKWAFSLYFLI